MDRFEDSVVTLESIFVPEFEIVSIDRWSVERVFCPPAHLVGRPAEIASVLFDHLIGDRIVTEAPGRTGVAPLKEENQTVWVHLGQKQHLALLPGTP